MKINHTVKCVIFLLKSCLSTTNKHLWKGKEMKKLESLSDALTIALFIEMALLLVLSFITAFMVMAL